MTEIRKFDEKDLDKILSRLNSGKFSNGWSIKTMRDLVKYVRWLSGLLPGQEVKKDA